jgi:hypothetical protein
MDSTEDHNVTLLRIHSDLSELSSLKRLAPLIRWLLFGAFAIAVWVTTNDISIRKLNRLAEQHQIAIQENEVWRATTESSRYTSQEAAALNKVVLESFNAHDKRLQRLEDAGIQVQRSLDRIEQALMPNQASTPTIK